MSLRSAWRILSLLNLGRSAARGPASLTRTLVRRQAHKSLAKGMRGIGL